jgi:exonuclease III
MMTFLSFKKRKQDRSPPAAGIVLCILLVWLASAMGTNSAFEKKLSISTINCNSLNSSVTSKSNRNLKIHGITKLATDIIFLCDTRLSNKNLVTCEDEIRKDFQLNMYDGFDCFFNSKRNKRGVGILINKKIPLIVQEREDDVEENFLLLKVAIAGEMIVIGSIYGPNHLDLEFFNKLTVGLIKLNPLNDLPVILGGDWNCTVCTDPVHLNIDVLNMAELPNRRHSERLNEMCDILKLCDPYRILHFNKVDFTYSPRSDAQKNRSRLDFFLISDSLVNVVTSCDIKDTLQNKLFDHKAVELKLNVKKDVRVNRQFIDNKILNSDVIDIVVHCAVAESYVQHMRNNPHRAGLMNNIGQLKLIIFNLGLHWRDKPGEETSEDEIRAREGLLDRARYLMQNLDIRVFEIAELDCDRDIFMEILINNVRNDTCSYQAFFLNEKKKKFKEGITKLRSLKSNYSENADRIKVLENSLNIAVDLELRAELEKYDIFEHIESEKASPKFLKIAKSGVQSESMDKIKNSDGNDFLSVTDRKTFITEYFRNIYKEVPGRVHAYEGCIEDFLGADILNHPEVASKKVPANLREELEQDISLIELDKSLEKMRSGSAGGPDGLSVKFVKRFWVYFRVPLQQYVKTCVHKGTLTNSFATASIKLIPKKGDVEKIKNWRPISLLNILYKVAAKAVNNRLKKIAPFCISRSQKGFVDKRYIQECLLNISETINFAESTGTKGFCLAIDQAKAFDSVNHNYLLEVYKFFGLGNRFIDLISTLTTNRCANIIFDDGTRGCDFPLECGNAQGNSPSPLQFNLANQILIFKVEYHKDIKSIMSIRSVLGRMSGNRAPGGQQNQQQLEGGHEVGQQLEQQVLLHHGQQLQLQLEQGNIGKSDKLEAFADDGTVLALAEERALIAIKNVLYEFERISGLACNMDKSNIMPIGFTNGDEIPLWIRESGFQLVDNISILGIKISRNVSDLKDNFVNIIKKVNGTKRFWERFNLSLPGRMAVAKSLMLSQVSYLGCIVKPDTVHINELKNLIYGFVKGKINVAKDKVTLDPKFGGLGMIEIDSFIIAQQCGWLKRLHNGAHDTYKEVLRLAGCANTAIVDPNRCPLDKWPILGGIWQSICKFYSKFVQSDSNWEKVPVLYNPLFKMDRGGGHDNNKLFPAQCATHQ